MQKLKIAVIFGGKSAEHDVSIISTLQILPFIDTQKYELYLIYLDQNNQGYLCSQTHSQDKKNFIEKTLKNKQKLEFANQGFIFHQGLINKKIQIDAAILVLHGSYVEDGKFEGLLDFYDIPYTSSGVLGSALGMDKVLTKQLFKALGLEIAKYEWFKREELKKESKQITENIEKKLKYPLFVKPANCGSSIGISKVKKREELLPALEKAAKYDGKIIVEEAIVDAVDINCAVLGGSSPFTTLCEQPIADEEFLTFKEKYLKGGKNKGMAGLSRIVPAPIPQNISSQIQEMSKQIFVNFSLWGVVRIDFLYQKTTKKVFPNEINTLPGSLAYYLFEASGIPGPELIDKLIEFALARKEIINQSDYSFTSKLLDQK